MCAYAHMYVYKERERERGVGLSLYVTISLNLVYNGLNDMMLIYLILSDQPMWPDGILACVIEFCLCFSHHIIYCLIRPDPI